MNDDDLIGKKFNKLTIIERCGSDNSYHKLYKCKCDCGNYAVLRGTNIIRGVTKTCGCLIIETNTKRLTRHGKYGTRIYRIWNGIMTRCSHSAKSHPRYSGRGIDVCDEWRSDFVNFYNWAMKNGYNKELSIDRIDNNGNYEPTNCKWSTNKEQARNNSRNVMIKYKGMTKCINEWAEYFGITENSIRYRLRKKWSMDKIESTKMAGSNRKINNEV